MSLLRHSGHICLHCQLCGVCNLRSEFDCRVGTWKTLDFLEHGA
uniref:Uncharacterized protein n=1 Tax=Anguilla anguilla TaxID=7936 RepID=A0A0E9U504_ANGAN